MTVVECDLVRRARAGDREAFGELVDRYRDMVYGLGYHLTGEFEAARDLAQEAFVQAYRKLAQLREPERFAGWLRQIAINCHRREVRRKRVSTVALAEVEAPPRDPLPSDVELVVREALAKLRPAERLTLTLHYINGYSHSEIGGFLGVRAEVVNSRLARARRHLREEVLAMAEEMFDEHALPGEFREDVVAAVDSLVARLWALLPENLDELLGRMPQEPSWCSILDRMPAPYGRPLSEGRFETDRPFGDSPMVEQEHAHRARVGDLPEELRSEVRQAIGRSWVELAFGLDKERPPWLRDPGRLYLRFYRGEEDQVLVAFCDVPRGPVGSTETFHIGPEQGDPLGPPTPAAEMDRALAFCAVPAEVRAVVARLRAAVPGADGTLGAFLHDEQARRLREIWEALPAEARAAMEAGTRVPATELPEPVQEQLHQMALLGWGSLVVGQIEHAPAWLTHVDEADLEFGLLPRDPASNSGGKVYLKLYAPEPHRHTYQSVLNCPVAAT